MNSKGQSFSAFNLLIVVIVALLMLSFIMPVFTSLVLPDKSDSLVSLAHDGVIQMKGNKGQHFLSKKLTQFKPGDFLSSKMIVDKGGIGLSYDQICISAGDFTGDPFWPVVREDEGGVSVQNMRNITTTVKYSIFCDTEHNFSVDKDTSFRELTNPPVNFRKGWYEECTPQIIDPTKAANDSKNKLVCLVALRFGN